MKNKETNSYNGWLNSNSFWKRVLSITGYSLFGSLIIWAIFFIISIFILG